MPRRVEFQGAVHEFPDGATDEQIRGALSGIAKPPEPKTWADKLGLENPIGRAIVDTGEGVAAGAALSVFKGGDTIRRGLGMNRVIDNPDVKQAMTAPDSMAGQVGKGAEQVAEILIPSMGATKALKAAQFGKAAIVGADALIAGGVTGLQTGGDPKAMAEAALVSGGVGAIASGLGAAARGGKAAQLLEESAKKEYGQVLAATKQGNKFLSQKSVAPGLLDRGVKAWTLKGLLGKANSAAEATGKLIGDAWDNLPAGTTVELDPVISKLTQQATDAFTIQTSGGAAKPVTSMAKSALDSVDYMKQLLTDVAETNPTTGALEVPVAKLRQLRQAWDEVAAQAKVYQGQQLADHATGKVHAMAADAIREQLAADFPSIATLNKEYKFWKDAVRVIGDTVTRREGQAVPMSRQIASAAGAAAGAATGGIHGAMVGKVAMGQLQQAISSAAWKTTSAVYKDRLAKALANGNRGMAEFYIGKIAKSIAAESAIPAQPTGQLVPAVAQ